jgi:hypothetical protein
MPKSQRLRDKQEKEEINKKQVIPNRDASIDLNNRQNNKFEKSKINNSNVNSN